MKTHTWLSPAVTRRGKHSKQTTRAWAARGIVAMALALGSLGAAGAALSAHDSAGHASTHQTSVHSSLAVVTPAPSVRMAPMAWMF
jgi:hypothetical protein